MLKVTSIVLVGMKFWPFFTLNRLTAVTPCGDKYSKMFSSVSSLRFLSLIIPFEEFNVLCVVTSTGRLKNLFSFSKFSV